MARQLQMTYDVRDGYQALSVRGEVDIATAPELLEEAGALLSRGATNILLDLTGVSFIDSSGLSALLSLRSLCERDGRQLTLTHGQPQVERLFEITGMLEQLTFVRPLPAGGARGALAPPASDGPTRRDQPDRNG